MQTGGMLPAPTPSPTQQNKARNNNVKATPPTNNTSTSSDTTNKTETPKGATNATPSGTTTSPTLTSNTATLTTSSSTQTSEYDDGGEHSYGHSGLWHNHVWCRIKEKNGGKIKKIRQNKKDEIPEHPMYEKEVWAGTMGLCETNGTLPHRYRE